MHMRHLFFLLLLTSKHRYNAVYFNYNFDADFSNFYGSLSISFLTIDIPILHSKVFFFFFLVIINNKIDITESVNFAIRNLYLELTLLLPISRSSQQFLSGIKGSLT